MRSRDHVGQRLFEPIRDIERAMFRLVLPPVPM